MPLTRTDPAQPIRCERTPRARWVGPLVPRGGDMDGPTGSTCDRCGPSVRASSTFTRAGKAIDWCDHHSRDHGPKLTATGWVRRQLAVPDLPDVGAGSIVGG